MTPLQVVLHYTQIRKISKILDYEEPRVIRRASILSCLHEGMSSSVVAKALRVDPKTVQNVANAFLESDLDSALYDEERSGRPIDFDDRERSRTVAMVCSDPPDGAYRWTLELIAEESKKRGLIDSSTISKEQIRIILQEHDLKPWQEKMWCISKIDNEFIERMEDVLDIYEKPYSKDFPVICIDEKPVQLISDTRDRVIPQGPGEILKVDYEYERNGSVNVFCGIEPKIGKYFNEVTERRCGKDFCKFLEMIAEEYSESKKIILVMDNLSIHKLKFFDEYYDQQAAQALKDRFEVHHTPVHASWLNQAEIAIGMYSRQCLGNGRLGSIDYLKNQTAAWNARMNKKRTTIHWRFTKTKARKSFQYSKIKSNHAEKLI